MRKTLIYMLLAAIAAVATAALFESAPVVAAKADKPDLIIFFSGDVQGYLEECG